MSIKRTIKAAEFVNDVRRGMTDYHLMTKYDLVPPEFDSILAHLIDSGLMTRQELEDRQQFSESQIIRLFVESREDSKQLG
jgi:hypothetical protein